MIILIIINNNNNNNNRNINNSSSSNNNNNTNNNNNNNTNNNNNIWREKEKSRIRAIQIENLRGLLGIRRMDKKPECTDQTVVQGDKGCRRIYS